MVAMPIMTSARVANVQKKSRLRKAAKKPVIAGSLIAINTVSTAAAAPVRAIAIVNRPAGIRR